MRGKSRRPVRLRTKLAIATGAAVPLLAVATLVPSVAMSSLTKSTPALAKVVPQTAKVHPLVRAAPVPAKFFGLCSGGFAEASRLDHDLSGALASRGGIISVALTDLDTGVTCAAHSGRHFDSASVIKATILAALLHQAQVRGSWLSGREQRLATAMITRSDNNAASALWWEVGGHSGVQRFLDEAGMDDTTAGYGGTWGLSQITAADQVKLLSLLVNPNRVLSDGSRAYELGLMRRVEGDQRWGVPSGVPAGDRVANKNGWLPRATLGWRVHSIGAVTGAHTYLIAILSEGDPSMGYGVTTVNRIAQVLNRDANL